jgi:hypothetical protein
LVSDGAGSVLDVSALAAFAYAFSGTHSALQASNQGTLLDGALTSLNHVGVTLDGIVPLFGNRLFIYPQESNGYRLPFVGTDWTRRRACLIFQGHTRKDRLR